ncbi:MAG: PAS domain-containing sensor histidine kinase [Desulfobacteraceae bacterium]|nr:MAG: PAS domain-containing sensor histidine kinase [Desulfobacteraceae bacterium]
MKNGKGDIIMKKENKAAESEPKPVALRERAEKIALEKALPENIDKISQAEVKRTIQELQVHQIELEMQNEELRLTQRELKASQARYLDLYDLAPVSYVTVSEKGLILEANLTAAALLGLPRSALVKQPLTRFIINEDQNIYYLHRKQLFETGAPQAFELRMVKKDETAFWAHLVATAAQDADGAPVCRVVLSDITEHKLAEEALIKSELKCRYILLNTPQIGISLDSDGKIIFVNDHFQKLTGWKAEEIIGQDWFDIFIPGKIREEIRNVFKAVMRQEDTAGHSTYENDIVIKNGELRLISWANVLTKDLQGKIIDVTCLGMDLTERIRNEEALRNSENKFRNISEYSLVGIYMIQDGIFSYVNSKFAEIFGYTIEECLNNMHFRQLVYPEDFDIVQEQVRKRATGEIQSVHYGFRGIKKTGELIHVEIFGSSIMLDGRPTVTGTMLDITMRKRAEQEKRNLEERLHNAEKMEVLGKLAGRVAHDLNNVLGVLSGYSELLTIRIPADNPLKEYAINIVQSSVKAAAIVEDLLTLTRRGVRVMEVAKVNKIIADLIATPEFDKLVAYHPSVIVRTDLAKDLLNISGSPVHLEKTVFNLVSNAVEAIAGGGKVIIKTENRYIDKAIEGSQTVAEGEYVVLTVSDTGKGIPASELKKIYEPFYTKKSMRRSGTGLGLAIVQGAVQDHDGYIDVQSTEGKGTTFTLYFPATREKAAAELQKTPMDQYTGRGETVLVVDDVKEQREVATTLFTQLGYSVNAVSSGEDAVEYLKSNKADILVLDMIMEPGIDGLDTYKLVLEINPLQKAVIVSGFSETDRSREAQKLGAGPYVKKPYMIETIGIAIRDELGRK